MSARVWCVAVAVAALAAWPAAAQEELEVTVEATTALTTPFYFQGQLNDGGVPANGSYDFELRLRDAAVGGTVVGTPVHADNVTVADGFFSLSVDFGSAALSGSPRWLEIGVRPGTSTGAYETLQPLQPLMPTPYSSQSGTATGLECDGCVGESDLAAGAVTSTRLHDTAVGTGKLADKAVATGKLADKAVGTAQLADKGVGTAQLADKAVTATKLADNAVTSTALANAAVTGTDLAAKAVSKGHLNAAGGTAGQVLATTGTSLVWQDGSGLTLPYKGEKSDPGTLLTITNQGAGRAALFGISNALNANAALRAETNGTGLAVLGVSTGTGNAASFAVENPASTAYALAASNNGAGGALLAESAGTGGVTLQVRTTGVTNPGDVVNVTSSGTGRAVMVTQGNPANTANALSSEHLGKGPAGTFRVANAASPSYALGASTTGTGTALLVEQAGSAGVGLKVQSKGAANTDPAVQIQKTGAGRALLVESTNPALNVAAVRVDNAGTGTGLYVSSPGSVIHALQTTASEQGPVLGGWAKGKSIAVYAFAEADYPALVAIQNVINPVEPVARFTGEVDVQGRLSASIKEFRIDHPQDPEGAFLQHASVESSEMLTAYSGNVTLDEAGAAVVELPPWFEALNRDFRYQLTCVGAFAPVFVAEEVAGGRFTIGGGTPGLKVSWMVTAVRHDPWAEANPLVVEQAKTGEEQGRYVVPELYGKGPEARLGQRYPAPQEAGPESPTRAPE